MTRRFRRLLAGLLLLQVVLAPTLCLGRGSASGLMEICTAEGLKLIRMTEDGAGAPATPEGFCPLCHALPQTPIADAPLPPAPLWMRQEAAWRAAGPPAPPPAIRGPPSGSRAPPLLLS
ncbi:hypothetical protein KTR66_20225 [Roseococcus sp. SDR]|uniref:DUF2946 family protein n=1 Tax=Roseococcus sp. SDR TaxID=2835532 RepID=UPI001BCA9460|nr:DUF2946 family protein [Roseococcus sp. SDR]MBS7792330.1 hypothetical protein [Roseococcus sp. SDR]MBV1847644.1 hypothetical protein [Roseococcus sp. SDR]